MTESDCEIEFLDEDAEIVQQCVLTDEIPAPTINEKPLLLVERRPVEKSRKRKKEEEDSDFDPSEYRNTRNRKRKVQTIPNKLTVKRKYDSHIIPVQTKIDNNEYGRKIIKRPTKNELLQRKQLDIRIPDYEDPLCLPVRMLSCGPHVNKLRIWNNICLEHFKHCDKVLKPESGQTVASKRTIVLRNVKDKYTGKQETSMWSKTSVENKDGDRKSEVVKCILPKYRERKVLEFYNLTEMKRRRQFHHRSEVILTKEDQKDGERLIVYKPKEALSLVYKMFEKTIDSDNENDDDEEQKRYMKEVACCKVCAPCYQVSWRGFRNNDKKIRCQICSQLCINVYNLLSHLKTHSVKDINKYKNLISRALARVVEYHYKCRICQNSFTGVKELRRHVLTHCGTDPFICDIGHHVAT